MIILFENQHFLAVDKPSEWLCVSSRQGAADARRCLSRELETEKGTRLWPVHRLDQEVSGLVLFAKNAEAHRVANHWFEERMIHKQYEAFTEGTSASLNRGQTFEWRSQLLKGKKRAFESERGKASLTEATWLGVVELEKTQALHWRLRPMTGRSHQLRFELSKQGFPILGDGLYGATKAFDAPGIALRSIELNFQNCVEANSFGLPAAINVKSLGEVLRDSIA